MSTTSTPKTMLAWRKRYESNQPKRVEVAVPATPEDGLLVKIYAAGVCHTDHMILELTAPAPGYRHPEEFTLGHEICGEIVSIGSKVSGFSTGEVVAILAVPGCGESTCHECNVGLTQCCVAGDHHGIDMDGAFADYLAVKAKTAIKLPPGVSPAVAAVATDAVNTAYHAIVGRAQVKSGETVLLFGLGGLGFNALQILKHLGARAIVVDKRQFVLDEAVKFGVRPEDVVPLDTADVAEWIGSQNLIIDKVVDFLGINDSFTSSLAAVRPGGIIAIVGLLGIGKKLDFDVAQAIMKHVDIVGCFGGNYQDVTASLDLISQGVVKPQVEMASMADFPRVLSDLHSGKVKSRMALIPEGLEKTVGWR